MKRFMLLILMLMSSFISCKAQTIYPLGSTDIVESHYYVKDINHHHDDIVGVWKWEDGDSSFEITLQEFEMYSDYIISSEYRDRIFGKYKYIENGILISEILSIETLPNYKITLIYKSPTVYIIYIRDIISETSKVGEFVLTSPTTATIELREIGGVRVNYGNGLEWALPTSLTLTKQ